MIRKLGRRVFAAGFVAAALAAAVGVPETAAQDDRGRQTGERRVDPIDLPLDKPGAMWTLNFRYKPPRIVTVDGFTTKIDPATKKPVAVPAKKTVWYMWYQVYNRNGEPVSIFPEFELVTRDLNTSHLDEPEPYIFNQIKKFEDPTGILDLKSTIEISRRPIPASLPDAFPKLVSGLAVWTDMTSEGGKAPKTNRFSVYVTGLSNGVASEETKPVGAKNEVVTLIKKKTLRIDFLRPTDDNRPQITDIRPDDSNGPAETWVYRTAGTLKPRAAGAGKPADDKPAEDKKK